MIAAAYYGRLIRGNFSRLNPVAALEAMAAQRIAEVRGASLQIDGFLPASVEVTQAAGVKDIDVPETTDHYRALRGQKPNGLNRSMPSHQMTAEAWHAFHLAEILLTLPIYIVVGDKPGAFGSYRDGCEIAERAVSKEKILVVAEGWSHDDLYDKQGPVKLLSTGLFRSTRRILAAHKQDRFARPIFRRTARILLPWAGYNLPITAIMWPLSLSRQMS